ncbi:unnamed protein product [Rangifer tarandus platyrhynchus]|uniref:Uncharacterized protein n=1 Tax=Rangifer tarandus platyrhynchus TaxID=3082113 RepID=A0ABN9A266_RANTA|nr:unnamed protein product [Rangifer tarandus platyrhynchus]
MRGAVLTAACRGRAESSGIKGPLSKGLLAGLKALASSSTVARLETEMQFPLRLAAAAKASRGGELASEGVARAADAAGTCPSWFPGGCQPPPPPRSPGAGARERVGLRPPRAAGSPSTRRLIRSSSLTISPAPPPHVFPFPWVSSNYHSHALLAAVLYG